MQRIGVGLIGYGLAGKVFHAPLIASEPRLRLAAIVTTRRADVESDLPEVAVLATADQLLADSSIDLVVIATPNATHFPLARAALEARKHVVVDKPFTLTVAEADALIVLAEKNRRLLTVFHNRRWDGDFLTVQKTIQQGLLGRVAYFESHFDRFRPQIKPGWREAMGPGSGIFFDLGPHLIDQALMLFGMPESVTGDITRLRSQAQADDYFHVILRYSDKRVVLHASNLAAKPGPRFVLHGDAGSFVKHGLDPQEEQLKQGRRPGHQGWGRVPATDDGILTDASGHERTIATVAGSYEGFYAGVASALLDGTRPPVSADEARAVMRVIEAARHSADRNQTVQLRESR